MIDCHILVLFITAVARTSDAEDIQNVLQEVLSSKASHQHVREDYNHDLHHGKHHDGHDGTNIETLNLVFKHNKIIPPSALSKPIARTGGDKSDLVSSNELMCKLGARCGCGNNAQRCGCKGRSGGSCELDHDHIYDDAVFLKPNPDYIKAKASKKRNSVLNNNNNHANPAIVKLFDDLEKSLLDQSIADKNLNELGKNVELPCDGDTCDDRYDKYDDDRKGNEERDSDVIKSDGYMDSLLNNPEKNDENHIAHLRCCQSCARKSYYRSSNGDKAYLRCCKQCSKKKFFRADDSDRKDRDDDRDWRDRSNSRDHRDRSDDRDRKSRSYNKDGRDSSNYRYDVRDRNDKRDPFDRARIFHINDDLNAIILDVSDVDSVLKALSNANNFDNSNSVRDYMKVVNANLDSKPKNVKYQKKLLPPTFQQKIKIRDMYRRSGKSGVGQYGVPFELDIQGLGQVNP